MKGIDISSNNGIVDFNKVKASGVEIVYIKATEGATYINPLLKQSYASAKSAGLKVGFYHYLRANEPSTESNNFLNAIKDLQSDCKYAIDVEIALSQTVNTISLNARLFANDLIRVGKEPLIYTGLYFYNDNLNDTVKDIPLWVASYNINKPIVKSIGWQYSESAVIDGVNGNCDINDFDYDILLNNVGVLETMNIKDLQTYLNSTGVRNSVDGKLLVVDGQVGVRTISVKDKVKEILTYILK